MLVTRDQIHGCGRERNIFGRVEHAEFEACAEGALEGTIHIRFGDETARDGLRNLIEDVITSQVTPMLQRQRGGFSRIVRDLVIEVKI